MITEEPNSGNFVISWFIIKSPEVGKMIKYWKESIYTKGLLLHLNSNCLAHLVYLWSSAFVLHLLSLNGSTLFGNQRPYGSFLQGCTSVYAGYVTDWLTRLEYWRQMTILATIPLVPLSLAMLFMNKLQVFCEAFDIPYAFAIYLFFSRIYFEHTETCPIPRLTVLFRTHQRPFQFIASFMCVACT